MKYIIFLLIMTSMAGFIRKKTRRISFILSVFIFLSLIIALPHHSIDAAKNGINLWLYIVVPSLFPFFIINDILVSMRVPESLSNFCAPLARILFNTSGYGAYVFIMSIFSGYPVGAKITSQLIDERKITPLEGQKILSFSSTSGPLFIIGAVGAGMLKSTAAGYIIYISHITASIINGLLYNLIYRKKTQSINFRGDLNIKKQGIGEMLTKAITGSLFTLSIIGGYIVLFSVIITLLESIDFFNLLNAFLNNFLFLPNTISTLISNIIKTSLEISNGCKLVSLMGINFNSKLVIISFIIAFSGLSIIGQVSSLIRNSGIDFKKYILSKLSHGIISALICSIIISIKPQAVQTFNKTPNLNISKIFINIKLLLIVILLLNILSYTFKKISKKKHKIYL